MSGDVEVTEPGLSTTVQDLGRIGWLRVGVPQSGALDREALRLANALVGGGPAQAALEIRYLGPTLRALTEPLRAALVGAEASMRLERAGAGAGGERESRDIGPWRSVTLHRGDLLRVGSLRGGATAILALGGGVAAPMALGARATFSRGGFGGIEGRALRRGDRLSLAAPPAAGLGPERWIPPDQRPPAPRPGADGAYRVRVVLGPQQDHFPEAEIERFLTSVWTVSAAADRMGMRLDGPRLAHDAAAGKGFNIVSDGVSEGAIQVPGDGRPILLLADRGVSGGYPKIAVAASVDTPLLGRLAPGDRLRFHSVSVGAAQAALRAREQGVAAALAAVAPYREPGAVDEAQLWSANLITARAPLDDEP